MAAGCASKPCSLEIICAETQVGECVGVLGEAQELGRWEPANALRLTTTEEAFPAWLSSEVPWIAPGTQYKFVVLEPGGGVRWEPIPENRSWPSDMPAGGVLRAWFGEPSQILETRHPSADTSTRLGSRDSGSSGAGPSVNGHHAPELSAGTLRQNSRLRERLIAASSHGDIRDSYDLETVPMGSGSFGVVSRARCKEHGDVRAVKSVVKAHITNFPALDKEIDIARSLDHPNIVRLFETFEDDRSIYLVMELCEGGELLDRIVEARRLTEAQASLLLQQMLRGLAYLHEAEVSHRDLKPENFMFAHKGPVEASPLKMIDFGLARRFNRGEEMTSCVGTLHYAAPEVFSGRYTEVCDLWSCGVILYIMLSGRPPFCAKADSETMRLVRAGRYSMDGPVWAGVSSRAKALIRGLLRFEPSERLTAAQALEDDWTIHGHPDTAAAGQELHTTLVENLQAWRRESRFKRAAMAAIAGHLTEKQIDSLRDVFLALDTDNSGTLTLAEMRDGMHRAGLQVPQDLREVMEELDTCEHVGNISYSEFLTAALDRRSLALEDLCWHAFRSFDKNGDGKISKDEVRLVLEHDFLLNVPDAQIIAAELGQWDVDQSGYVDFTEFLAMMRKAS